MKTKGTFFLVLMLFAVSAVTWFASAPAFETEQPVSGWEKILLVPRAYHAQQEAGRFWRRHWDWGKLARRPYQITYHQDRHWSVKLQYHDRKWEEEHPDVIVTYIIEFPTELWLNEKAQWN